MLEFLINTGGILLAPTSYIGQKIGWSMPNQGWETMKLNYCKEFEFGMEAQNEALGFLDTNEIRKRAIFAVSLALEKFGDIVVEPDIRVKPGIVEKVSGPITGYQIDLGWDRDYSKPVMIDIIHDASQKAYRIIAAVYEHFIDGVPAALMVNLIHNHIILGDLSYLSGLKRKPRYMYQDIIDRFDKQPDRSGWYRICQLDQDKLWPVGGYIDVTNSNIVKLKNKIKAEKGVNVSAASLEIALLALDLKMTYVADCVARGKANGSGQTDVFYGYDGLGMVRTRGYGSIAELPLQEQYEKLCEIVIKSAEAAKQERNKTGASSVFLERFGRIERSLIDLFQRRVSYHGVMSVANTQLIGSNLNGVDFNVPSQVGPLMPGDVRYFFTPSHGEFNPSIYEARKKRNLPAHVTEVSLACGPRVKDQNGRLIMYKSIKTSYKKACELLRGFGYESDQFNNKSINQILELFFQVMYSPRCPMEGRIEKLAERFLHC